MQTLKGLSPQHILCREPSILESIIGGDSVPMQFLDGHMGSIALLVKSGLGTADSVIIDLNKEEEDSVADAQVTD